MCWTQAENNLTHILKDFLKQLYKSVVLCAHELCCLTLNILYTANSGTITNILLKNYSCINYLKIKTHINRAKKNIRWVTNSSTIVMKCTLKLRKWKILHCFLSMNTIYDKNKRECKIRTEIQIQTRTFHK